MNLNIILTVSGVKTRKATIMPLSAAERQRRCRERRKTQPDKFAEVKRKDLERYHARKKLVKDMTTREHELMKQKWRIRNNKRRMSQKCHPCK